MPSSVKPLPGYPRQRPLETADELIEYTHGTPGAIVCLLCGRKYRALGNHLPKKHGVEPDAYRERYGLRWCAGLSCQETLSKHSAHTTELVAGGALKPRWVPGESNRGGVRRLPAPAVRAAITAASVGKARATRAGRTPEELARMDARNARGHALRARRRAVKS